MFEAGEQRCSWGPATSDDRPGAADEDPEGCSSHVSIEEEQTPAWLCPRPRAAHPGWDSRSLSKRRHGAGGRKQE
uniref:Uncharacterized protein n=1 Tax=Rangifer tarandus platyrhynchus TaxID=3082113 RepID=A0ACB0F037_RANTA|nr:unnamed protein product [Rangifer tarandus platyrhynchus]